MTKEEWIRLNDLLIKNYASFQQDYIDSTKGKTSKIKKLANRNMGFALGRVEYWIKEKEGSRLMLKDFLSGKPYTNEEFFQTKYFLTEMQGFLELIANSIRSFE